MVSLSLAPKPGGCNFWQPGGSATFKVTEPGASFLFKLKYPLNAIWGMGFFSSHTFLPLSSGSCYQPLLNFSYGCEGKLAGTGLFESYFRSAFLHPGFEEVINYIYPGAPRDFEHEPDLEEFCAGIFNYNIQGYNEVLPIRLASYFYPNQLLPIFKIDHLEQICNSFGFTIEAHTMGEKLYAFNSYLKDQMEEVEGDNTIKMYICSQVHYAIDLRNRINDGEFHDDIFTNCRKKWIRSFYEKGMEILINLNLA